MAYEAHIEINYPPAAGYCITERGLLLAGEQQTSFGERRGAALVSGVRTTCAADGDELLLCEKDRRLREIMDHAE